MSAIYPPIFKGNFVPVFPFAILASIHHLQHFQTAKFLLLCWVGFFLFAARLIITAFAVKLMQNPCQFSSANRLGECFLSKIINRPIIRNTLVFSKHIRMFFAKLVEHLAERIHKEKLPCIAPCNFGLFSLINLAISIQMALIVFGQITKNIQHTI